MGDNSDITSAVSEIMGNTGSSSEFYERPKYDAYYNHSLQRPPYIAPRRTKDFWPKHFPNDGKR
ncbi:MAG: hypothetical protein QXM31_04620 [Candidatus Woesearchaeota archaeon]